MSGLVLDLFAGPGGWDVAAERLGIHPIGLEIDADAVRTRYAAGHATWEQDVAAVTDAQLERLAAAGVEGLIASPPCQDFSVAGTRYGIDGDRGQLMRQVPRWVEALQPQWIACEQVPPALEWFRLFAHQFTEAGYRTWAGVLNAADYGVPQTRKRAVLIASRSAVSPPPPTHAEELNHGPDLFGAAALAPWVSTAAAIGWPESVTIRQHKGEGMAARFGHDPWRPASRPFLTVTGRRSRVQVNGHPDGRRWPTTAETARVQTFPDGYPWKGNRDQQIGNAIPPLLAQRILEAVTARPASPTPVKGWNVIDTDTVGVKVVAPPRDGMVMVAVWSEPSDPDTVTAWLTPAQARKFAVALLEAANEQTEVQE